MENLLNTAQALITYIKWGSVFDTADDDGDGHVDYSQSHELKTLTEDLEHAIEEAAPLTDAINLIKEGFITAVQTAIARQSQ